MDQYCLPIAGAKMRNPNGKRKVIRIEGEQSPSAKPVRILIDTSSSVPQRRFGWRLQRKPVGECIVLISHLQVTSQELQTNIVSNNAESASRITRMLMRNFIRMLVKEISNSTKMTPFIKAATFRLRFVFEVRLEVFDCNNLKTLNATTMTSQPTCEL